MSEPAFEPVSMTDESRPVERVERITALDSLRGFALLGILLMNIVAMGMYFGAYDDPTVTGGSTGLNLWAWIVMHVLAEGKMRCLFSLVFGASAILLTSRLEERGISAGDIFYRRTLWLILFGIVHAYLLWGGDILYIYGVCGLILFPFRKMSSKGLLILGSGFLMLNALAYIGLGFHQRDMLEKGRAALAAEKEGKKLTEEQESAKGDYERYRKMARPTPEELKKNDEKWRGNPLSVIQARAGMVFPFHSKPYYHPMSWDVWSMMFLGMGLMKLGVLSGSKSYRFYGLCVLIGYGIGIPVNSFTAVKIIESNFDPVVKAFMASTYDIGRLSVALGHLGMIMLLAKAGLMRWIMMPLGAVGQMAFSNYIFHSVVTAFYFTGYGLAMYGRLERYQLYYVVAAIWAVQMIASPIWLRYFRFGPLEWAWRSLTYWERQPMLLERQSVVDGVRTASA